MPYREGDVVRMHIPEELLEPMANADTEMVIDTVVVDPHKLFQFINDQCNLLLEIGLEPDFLLIGSEDFSRVTRSAYVHQLLDFRFADGPKRIHGLPVRVVPTITGMCVVPKAR